MPPFMDAFGKECGWPQAVVGPSIWGLRVYGLWGTMRGPLKGTTGVKRGHIRLAWGLGFLWGAFLGGAHNKGYCLFWGVPPEAFVFGCGSGLGDVGVARVFGGPGWRAKTVNV